MNKLERINEINLRLQYLRNKSTSEKNIDDVWEMIDLEDLKDELLSQLEEDELKYKNL